MDHNHHWLPQNGDRYHRRSSSHHPPQDPSHFTGVAADTVQRAQQLLAVYPMASATPTNHGEFYISFENLELNLYQLLDISAT